MAEGTVYNIVDKIFWNLKSPTLKQIGSAWGVTEELRKLDEKLLIIKGLVLDAEEKQVRNDELIIEWLRRLKDVVYDADDVLDDFTTQAFRRQVEIRGSVRREVGYFFTRSNPFKFCFGIVHKLKDIRERVDEIVNDMRGFRLEERVLEWQWQVVVDIRGGRGRNKTEYSVDQPFWGFVGRQTDVKAVGEMLQLNNNDRVSVISIVGEGGLGKTTLAQYFYEYWNVAGFQMRTWVCVSEDFEIEKIVRKMIGVDGLDEQQLTSLLEEKLRGNKFFLVLDGVCNENASRCTKLLDKLTTVRESASGSKILVTTSSNMGTVLRHNAHYIDCLDHSDCLTLFSGLVHCEGKEEVEQAVAMSEGHIVNLVKGCKGVPLAIRTLGGLLNSKTKRDWFSLKKFEWEGNYILPELLKLSYDQMPSYLKQCLAYCALFPKNEEIHRDTIIQLWMAQGFIGSSSDKDDELEDMGHRYFDDLVGRSFFIQVYEEGELAGTLYVMHDLVHDFARSVAVSECLTISSNTSSSDSLISDRTRHVSVGSSLAGQNIMTPLLRAKKLRTLRVPGETEPTGLKSSSSLHLSQVLDTCVFLFLDL